MVHIYLCHSWKYYAARLKSIGFGKNNILFPLSILLLFVRLVYACDERFILPNSAGPGCLDYGKGAHHTPYIEFCTAVPCSAIHLSIRADCERTQLIPGTTLSQPIPGTTLSQPIPGTTLSQLIPDIPLPPTSSRSVLVPVSGGNASGGTVCNPRLVPDAVLCYGAVHERHPGPNQLHLV